MILETGGLHPDTSCGISRRRKPVPTNLQSRCRVRLRHRKKIFKQAVMATSPLSSRKDETCLKRLPEI